MPRIYNTNSRFDNRWVFLISAQSSIFFFILYVAKYLVNANINSIIISYRNMLYKKTYFSLFHPTQSCSVFFLREQPNINIAKCFSFVCFFKTCMQVWPGLVEFSFSSPISRLARTDGRQNSKIQQQPQRAATVVFFIFAITYVTIFDSHFFFFILPSVAIYL